MTIYTLYIKTHEVTGLKYLGQTTKDAYKYKGSGIDWKKHIQEHGNTVITKILYMGGDREEMKKLGRYYSMLWNVHISDEWANRIPETGGGASPSEETRKILREKHIGKKKPTRTEEHKKNISAATKGKSKPKTSEGLKKWYSTNPNRENAIDKQKESLKEWYKNNPEKTKEKGKKIKEYYKNNPKKLSERTQKIHDSSIRNKLEKYLRIIPLIVEGKTRHEILKITGFTIKNDIISAIKNGSHRVFDIFPELKQLICT